jgi:oligoribonuclease
MANKLFVDIETTGLNPNTGVILEVGMVVTDEKLNVVDKISKVIQNGKDLSPLMDDHVTKMHTSSGLLNEIDEMDEVNIRRAELELMLFVNKHFGDHKPEIHGNTVHFDKKWIDWHMPALGEHFNYRIVDVSSLKIMIRDFAPSMTYPNIKGKKPAHRAIEDITESIAEYNFYLTILGLLKERK